VSGLDRHRLTDPSLPRSSERERVAERLRRLARALAAAERPQIFGGLR